MWQVITNSNMPFTNVSEPFRTARLRQRGLQLRAERATFVGEAHGWKDRI